MFCVYTLLVVLATKEEEGYNLCWFLCLVL